MAKSQGIRITVDGRLALTTAQIAERYGISRDAMRTELRRYAIEPADHLDARTPLYLATVVDRVFKSRPGKGTPGRLRPRRNTLA